MKILLILIGAGVSLYLIYFLISFFINYIEYKDRTPKIGSKLTFNQFKAFYYVKPKAWSLDYFAVTYCVEIKMPYGVNDFYYTCNYKRIYFTSFWQEDINKNQQKVLDELKEKINETKKF